MEFGMIENIPPIISLSLKELNKTITYLVSHLDIFTYSNQSPEVRQVFIQVNKNIFEGL
jgi:hypothetical protein